MPYDYGVDMWSIGCTLYELYTGKILFTGDSNNQMLKAIMEIRGRITPKLYKRGQLSSVHFDENGHFLSVERDKVLAKVCADSFPCFYSKSSRITAPHTIPQQALGSHLAVRHTVLFLFIDWVVPGVDACGAC
jgi:serine/threonine-protein kinase PRP4